VKYDNIITQTQAQALMLAVMTRDGKRALEIVTDCLIHFSFENRLKRLDEMEDMQKAIMQLRMDKRDALSAFFAILLEQQ